jgi:hypothetical protein
MFSTRTNDTIDVIHNAGFFSCCSIKLNEIIEYYNKEHVLPKVVSSKQQFAWYKPGNMASSDITFTYFDEKIHNDTTVIEYITDIKYFHDDQFSDYSTIDYKNINPFIIRYFSPSQKIIQLCTYITTKYKFDPDNTCVLFYRGNDKNRETLICDYEEYIDKANEILKNNPSVQFLIQTDETEFLNKVKEAFPDNSFYFKDEIRHISKCNSTVDIIMKNKNFIFSQFYMAITILMSKCKYIVCGTGNCSIWILFYRGNCNNVYQNFQNDWLVHNLL